MLIASAECERRWHIIESYILPRVWTMIEVVGVRFRSREMWMGQSETEPSYVRIEVVTNLANRGTAQAMGLVTDVELFPRALVEELTPLT